MRCGGGGSRIWLHHNVIAHYVLRRFKIIEHPSSNLMTTSATHYVGYPISLQTSDLSMSVVTAQSLVADG